MTSYIEFVNDAPTSTRIEVTEFHWVGLGLKSTVSYVVSGDSKTYAVHADYLYRSYNETNGDTVYGFYRLPDPELTAHINELVQEARENEQNRPLPPTAGATIGGKG